MCVVNTSSLSTTWCGNVEIGCVEPDEQWWVQNGDLSILAGKAKVHMFFECWSLTHFMLGLGKFTNVCCLLFLLFQPAQDLMKKFSTNWLLTHTHCVQSFVLEYSVIIHVLLTLSSHYLIEESIKEPLSTQVFQILEDLNKSYWLYTVFSIWNNGNCEF